MALSKGCGRTLARPYDASFEFSVVRRVQDDSFLARVQSDLDIFAFRGRQITNLINDNCFIVSAIVLLVNAQGKVHIKIVNS